MAIDHRRFIAALENRSYEKIEIKRFDNLCYLIIHLNGTVHTLTDKTGRRKEYRHAWQAVSWLEKSFGIEKEDIDFTKIE